MIKRVAANERHFQDFGWLKTYWLLSFDTYYDPLNTHWGTLRVFNDDVVEGKQGFPTHPHREMEIVTLVHSGELTHEDSMGNRGVIRPGEVQRMSAGTGITHSEMNAGSEPCHLYQIWIFPQEKGIKPGYEQKSFPDRPDNELMPVASGQNRPGALTMHADATIYKGALEAGKSLDYRMEIERRVFVYVSEGDLTVSGERLQKGDQARIRDEAALRFTATAPSDFILINAPPAP
jgi:redox-sensitive bicupin YhaK (pirin superfamily)